MRKGKKREWRESRERRWERESEGGIGWEGGVLEERRLRVGGREEREKNGSGSVCVCFGCVYSVNAGQYCD